eukprot:gene2140-18189_t
MSQSPTSGRFKMLPPFDLEDHVFSDVRVVFSTSQASSKDGGHVMVANNQEDLSKASNEDDEHVMFAQYQEDLAKASSEDGEHVLVANNQEYLSKASSEDGGHVLVAKPHEDLSFLAHKVVLAHSSSVLKTMLLKSAEEQCGDGQQHMSSLMELGIPIEEEEQHAAEVLLRYMYTGKFTEEVDKALDKNPGSQPAGSSRTSLLVLLYRLADRLQVKGLLEECATAISNLEGKDLGSADDINCICSIISSAPLLCEKPPIDGLLTKCGNELIIQHPDATALCKGPPNELELFLRLTCHAMLALISSDLLQAESENDVLVLACHWVRHNTPSQSQLSLLSHRIRLKHLTIPCLANLNAIAPWFAATPQMLCKVLSLLGCTLQDMQQAGWNGPPAWFGPQRAITPLPLQQRTEFDEAYLLAVLRASVGQGLGGKASDAMDIAIPGVSGLKVYHRGYYFQGAIDAQRHPTDPAKCDLVFALRVSHALDDPGDAKVGVEDGGESGSYEKAAKKEVVKDTSADAHQWDLATWDTDMLPLPICVEAIIHENTDPICSLVSKSSLLPMNQSWMHVGVFWTDEQGDNDSNVDSITF